MVCMNCKAELSGEYCHCCGQSNRDVNESSFQFFKNIFSGLIGTDSKFFRSLKILTLKPGGLTKAWIEGKRIRYTPPVQLYLIIGGIFFLLNAYKPFIYIDVQTKSVISSLSGVKTGEALTPAQIESLESKNISLNAYKDVFQSKISVALAPLLLISLVLFSLLTYVLTLGLGFDLKTHFVFSLHWCSFYLLLETIRKSFSFGVTGEVVVLATGLLFLITACKKVYCRWLRAILTGLLLQIGFLFFLLFWMMAILFIISP